MMSSYQTKGLDDQSPTAHEAPDHEPPQHRLDLRDAAMLRIDCVVLHEHRSADGEEDLFQSATRQEMKHMPTEKIMKKKYSKMKLPAVDVTLKIALHGLQSLQLAISAEGQLKQATP
jgi:hypothetical protein